MEVDIREYAPEQFPMLHQAFIGAFSDYMVGFQPTSAQFDQRINYKFKIAPSLSALAWHEETPVGFVLHTLNDYQGKRTAYNGGTGVISQYRNTGVASSIYGFLIPKITSSGAERILLEMIDENSYAGKLYESLGFRFTRVLKCFRLKSQILPNQTHRIVLSKKWKAQYHNHFSFMPSFMDSPEQIVHNLQNEIILEAYHQEELAGHLIFQPLLGRISQLAIKPSLRGLGISRSLLAECQKLSEIKRLTIMNIPEDQHASIDALQSLGFENELNQFELELTL